MKGAWNQSTCSICLRGGFFVSIRTSYSKFNHTCCNGLFTRLGCLGGRVLTTRHVTRLVSSYFPATSTTLLPLLTSSKAPPHGNPVLLLLLSKNASSWFLLLLNVVVPRRKWKTTSSKRHLAPPLKRWKGGATHNRTDYCNRKRALK